MAQDYSISIDTEQVSAIATQLENDNKSLEDTLILTKTTIDSLKSVWTGPAAEATYEAYTVFADNFFQKYYDIIDQYVKFLRRNVVEGYTETEGIAEKLADSFK